MKASGPSLQLPRCPVFVQVGMKWELRSQLQPSRLLRSSSQKRNKRPRGTLTHPAVIAFATNSADCKLWIVDQLGGRFADLVSEVLVCRVSTLPRDALEYRRFDHKRGIGVAFF